MVQAQYRPYYILSLMRQDEKEDLSQSMLHLRQPKSYYHCELYNMMTKSRVKLQYV